ncbi:hypothetical protein IJG72_02435 [bacterium]|nr:hypothetical protein [bacterium]
MAGYLELAEAAIHKEGKTYILNIYSELFAVAMPAEFRFDMAVMCGPKWTVGDHNLKIKVKANEDGEEKQLVDTTIKIPHEQFVYHAVANDVKFTMNYDVRYLTFTVFDNDEEVISRVYPVRAMLYPSQKPQQAQSEQTQEEQKEENKKAKKKKKD